jgi:hypothetical protein
LKTNAFLEGPQKSNKINDLAGPGFGGADFTASASGCQERETLQICNKKLLALFAGSAIIGA